jgi:aspartyl-tRNA(Asn)/glutamyl-tRNA(Gln) amidotransferase subunit A
VPRGYFFDLLDEEVRRRVEEAIDRFRAAGAAVHEVEIAGTADVAGTYVDVALAEAADYHRETIRSRPLEYTPGVRSRIETGSAIRPEQYQGAQARRAVLKHAVDAALAGCHALVLPALAIPAPPLGASTVTIGGRAEPVRSVMLRLTQVFNLTGHPAISIPCGHTSAGLPCGLQLVGRSGMTDALVDVAEICEPLSGGRAGLPPSREASADRRSLGGGG